MTHSLKALTRQETLMRNHHHLIAVDGHADLHSEHGPNRGEHSGRSVNPTIKVTDLAWLDSRSRTLIVPKPSRAPSVSR